MRYSAKTLSKFKANFTERKHIISKVLGIKQALALHHVACSRVPLEHVAPNSIHKHLYTDTTFDL